MSFSPADSTIRLGLESTGNTATLTIEDEGPGVDPEHLDRIFERYFTHRPERCKASRPVHGGASFGIGLWIVRRSVEATGGTINAENSWQGGTRMTVRAG